MKGRTTIAVGKFEVNDGMIVVGDPCYDRDDIEIMEAANGVYHAFAVVSDEGAWGVRVAELIAINDEFINLDWVLCGFVLPVDSGTMGIYDNEYHYDHHYNGLDEEWYDNNVCEGLSKDCRYNIVDNKCVLSESGLGDGCYDVYVAFNPNDKREIVAVKIVFIGEDDE